MTIVSNKKKTSKWPNQKQSETNKNSDFGSVIQKTIVYELIQAWQTEVVSGSKNNSFFSCTKKIVI